MNIILKLKRTKLLQLKENFIARDYLDIANIFLQCGSRIAGESFKRIQNRPITRASANITAERIFDLLHCQFLVFCETENDDMRAR